jgi:hypothetical protein
LSRPTTFLTAEEQERFGGWLKSAIKASGKIKNSVSRALGYDTNAQLNKYLGGGSFPGPDMVERIAEAIGIPRYLALLRAGHMGEVLLAAWKLEQYGRSLCKDYGVPLTFEWPAQVPIGQLVGGDFIDLPSIEGRRGPSLYVPVPTLIACTITVAGFQLPGETDRGQWRESVGYVLALSDTRIAAADNWMKLQGKRSVLPPLLHRARQDLQWRLIDRQDRLAVASFAVRQWVIAACKPVASYIRCAAYIACAHDTSNLRKSELLGVLVRSLIEENVRKSIDNQTNAGVTSIRGR